MYILSIYLGWNEESNFSTQNRERNSYKKATIQSKWKRCTLHSSRHWRVNYSITLKPCLNIIWNTIANAILCIESRSNSPSENYKAYKRLVPFIRFWQSNVGLFYHGKMNIRKLSEYITNSKKKKNID